MKKVSIIVSFVFVLVAAAMWVPEVEAYERYNDGCQSCHGEFTGDISPKGSTFPNNNKHTMHRSSSNMGTDCALCHRSDDDRNPFIGSSDGTDINPGLGCTGCHNELGLRAHHAINNVTTCFTTTGCHEPDPSPPTEDTKPVYYGTADTDADMPCNPVSQSGINENWTVDEVFEGLDNDGDNLYDADDPDCSAECTVDADCDNELFCDGAETCDTATNTCQAGTAPDCDDGVACTLDTCDEINDACVNTPDDAFCDDGASCNGDEFCDEINGCQPGTPTNCDDGVGCTDDSCDEVNDLCDNSPNDASCDDNDVCNGIETCDFFKGCLPGIPLDCNDNDSCTIDSCDSVTGCANDPVVCPDGEQCDPADGLCRVLPECAVDADCDNGLFCDGTEICDPTGTCQAGTPPDCNDGVGCTEDSCDEANGGCANSPVDTLCEDSDICNGIETCDPVNDCQLGTPLDCEDGNSCTIDSCDSVTGCINDPVVCPDGEQCDPADGVCKVPPECTVDADCDDGLFCSGAEICDEAGTCQPGTPPDCNDGVGCTEDSCDEANGGCANTPVDTLCDDNDICNGIETCDPVNDCQLGTPLDCEDGNSCTIDSCDSVTGCINDPVVCPDGEQCDPSDGLCKVPPECTVDADCDNGIFCDGAEICDEAGTCQPGTPPDCNDGVGCTVDSCDEANDVCDNSPDDASCDDGLFCTGSEFCDPVNDCSSTGDPCSAGDTCDEDNNECVAPPVVIDLDIARFSVTKSIRLAKVKPVAIKLVVKNNGTANSQTREATVTGMQMHDGLVVEVFAETLDVSDEVGNGRSTFNFPPYTPTATGDIIWTVTINDDDTDDDTATAVTSVK